MARWILLSLLVVGCASTSGERAQATSPAPNVTTTTTDFRLTFDTDSWTGEVEWALVEECALLGLSDCAARVEALKLGDCNVGAARSLLKALSGSGGLGPAPVFADLRSRGECAEVERQAWFVTRP